MFKLASAFESLKGNTEKSSNETAVYRVTNLFLLLVQEHSVNRIWPDRFNAANYA